MLAVKPPLLPCEEGTFAKPRMSCLESGGVVRFCRSRATRVICHCAGHWPLSDAAALDLDPLFHETSIARSPRFRERL